jgi:predicted amidohydrolase YtcJ
MHEIRACLMWMTLSLAASAAPAGAGAPDTILFNGKIFTSTQSQPYVQALAVQGDRIEAVGTSQRISRLAGPHTRQINLGGRLVIAGLNDAHNHMHIGPPDALELPLRGPNPMWPELKQAIGIPRRLSPSAVPNGSWTASPLKEPLLPVRELYLVQRGEPNRFLEICR